MLLKQVLTSARVPESQVGYPNLTSLAEPGFEIFGSIGLNAAFTGTGKHYCASRTTLFYGTRAQGNSCHFIIFFNS